MSVNIKDSSKPHDLNPVSARVSDDVYKYEDALSLEEIEASDEASLENKIATAEAVGELNDKLTQLQMCKLVEINGVNLAAYHNAITLTDYVNANKINGYYLHHISLEGAVPLTRWDNAFVTGVSTSIYTKDSTEFAKSIYCGQAQAYNLVFGLWYAKD